LYFAPAQTIQFDVTNLVSRTSTIVIDKGSSARGFFYFKKSISCLNIQIYNQLKTVLDLINTSIRVDIKHTLLESPLMNKSILIYSFSAALYLVAGTAQADNLCHRRAEARRHTATSQARLAYVNRVKSCKTLPSPDRAEQCIQVARATFERDSQTARAQYARDVQACGTET
jgi:hypothetical protein